MKDPKEIRVQEIMSAPVVSVKESDSLKEALRTMLSERISGVPVVNDQGYPIGVLSLKDVARYAEWHLESEDAAEDEADQQAAEDAAQEAGGIEEAFEERKPGEDEREDSSAEERTLHVDRLHRTSVGQVMTDEIAGLSWNSTLDMAIDLMFRLKVHRVFITDRKDQLAGVVSTVDVIRGLTKAKVSAERKSNPPAGDTPKGRGKKPAKSR